MLQSTLNLAPDLHAHYNELCDANGDTRPHWQGLIETLQHEKPALMRKRVDAVLRQVRDNGVTYNVYADTDGLQRPWGLDVLPFILPNDEWQNIAAAVAQRATLLNAILNDIYGDQLTIKSGTLPAALVHGHAGFLRPCHGIKHIDDIALHHYAADIARSPNGQWWVLSDRTQAPTGAGYALENRTVIASAFPELFRDLNIQRLSGFFATMRDNLAHWGRQCALKQTQSDTNIGPLSAGEQPLIVILTPGPYNETYHEQSYLAGYLGFPLVRGSDLTVRNGVAWLKTLSGLKPVHVILRRLDDDFCDPLELNSHSLLGVAGLTEVTRQGHVLVTNALGSNILQSGALLGYLPALCRQLLGEELRIPSVATWWCGEPAALKTVISNIRQLVIKPAFPHVFQHPIFGEDLNEQEIAALIVKLKTHPQDYIAQELVKISQAPVLNPLSENHEPTDWQRREETAQYRTENATDNALKSFELSSLAVGLRVYACATTNGYCIMPGGLARVASGQDARVISMQRGGTSKDTWITSPYLPSQLSLLRHTTSSRDLVRGNTYLSSRMVENLYWFGRYNVRNYHISRLLRTAIHFFIEFSSEHRAIEWPAVHKLCIWYGFMPLLDNHDDEENADTPETTEQSQSIDSTDEEIEALLIKAVFSHTSNSLASNIGQFFQLAFNLRERLSSDNWRIINQMSQQLNQASLQPTLADCLLQLDDTNASLVTITGFTLDGMTRDEGWRFMSVGRRIERLQFLCALIQHALMMPAESHLEWLLQLTDSIVTYRARYSAQPEWLPVLDLMLLDENNPNSMMFQLKDLVKYLVEISATYNGGGNEGRMIMRLESLKSINPDIAFNHGSQLLTTWLQKTYQASVEISEQLSLRFFSYSGMHSNTATFSQSNIYGIY